MVQTSIQKTDDGKIENLSEMPEELTNRKYEINLNHILPVTVVGLFDTTTPISTPLTAPITSFEINLFKEAFKFNAEKFVAFPGFCEWLHRCNNKISLQLLGVHSISSKDHPLDFEYLKKVVKDVCQELNECFLCPSLSDIMQTSIGEGVHDNASVSGGIDLLQQDTVRLVCQDGFIFQFPKNNCDMLPISRISAEELVIYLWGKILTKLNKDYLSKRGIHTMKVTCIKADKQNTVFQMAISKSGGDSSCDDTSFNINGETTKHFNVVRYITSNDLIPNPCIPTTTHNDSADGVSHALLPKYNILQESTATAKEESEESRAATVMYSHTS